MTGDNDFAFQLTTSHRGRLDSVMTGDNDFAFQLTTSHRGRQSEARADTEYYYFNSLPHTEVDMTLARSSLRPLEFQLTTSHRGRLPSSNNADTPIKISTHYLTQR